MARRLALDVLRLVDEGIWAREALPRAAAERAVPAADRALGAEIALGVLRTEGTLDVVLAACATRPLGRVDPDLLRILRIGAYQVLHLDRVPPRAAVHAAVEQTRAEGHDAAAGFVNAVLRGVARLAGEVVEAPVADERASLPRTDGRFLRLARPLFPDPAADLAGNLVARWAVPRAAVSRWLAQHGEAAVRRILAAAISRPPLSVRPAASRAEEVRAAFARAGIDVDPEGPCLLVRGAGDVRELPLWDAGAISVQDATAAEVVPFVAPASGERILDLCAAPGGKTLALAEAVGAAGRVVAVDESAERLVPLRAEVSRRGVANVEVVHADATDARALPPGPFDAVLADVPCSNSGVLSRRVEARRRLGDPAHLRSLTALQDAILRNAATRVARGGRLVYSTCSIDDEEDARRVRAFLGVSTAFRLEEERLTLPVPARRDGGYVARLRRRRAGDRAAL